MENMFTIAQSTTYPYDAGKCQNYHKTLMHPGGQRCIIALVEA